MSYKPRPDFLFLAKRFNELHEMKPEEGGFTEESDAQHDVILEEFEEYEEAYDDGSQAEVVEEMADVIVTILIQADRMGLDIGQAYHAKMMYNLQKSGAIDENGKVTDDADVEKPDFNEYTHGYEY